MKCWTNAKPDIIQKYMAVAIRSKREIERIRDAGRIVGKGPKSLYVIADNSGYLAKENFERTF